MKIFSAIILGLIGILSPYLEEGEKLINESLDNICEYIDNHVDNLNSILKLNGYDLVVNNIENYDITIDSVDGNFDGKILFINSKEFYFTIGEGLILYDYGFYASDLMYKYAKNGQLIFNVITGYFYRDGDSIVSLNGYDSSGEYLCGNDHYEGQATNMSGAGGIENTDLYIKARYGDGWSIESEKTLTYKYTTNDVPKKMEGFLQSNYQCYFSVDKDGNVSNEGNCCIVAPFTVARYILRKKYYYNNTAYANVSLYDPEEEEKDYFNSKNIVDSGTGNYLAPANRRNWCELYRKIRRTAYLECGKTEYLTIFQSSGILEKVLGKYSITIDSLEHTSWGSYINYYKDDIDNDRPLMWSTSTNTYGNHTMAVAGYKIYSKEEGWWIFKQKNYKNFAELRDGWSETPRYFDFSAYTGFAALVSMEY